MKINFLCFIKIIRAKFCTACHFRHKYLIHTAILHYKKRQTLIQSSKLFCWSWKFEHFVWGKTQLCRGYCLAIENAIIVLHTTHFHIWVCKICFACIFEYIWISFLDKLFNAIFLCERRVASMQWDKWNGCCQGPFSCHTYNLFIVLNYRVCQQKPDAA